MMHSPPNASEPGHSFHEEILEVLAEVPQQGSFPHRVVKEGGAEITHFVSWSTGMGSLAVAADYERELGQPAPRWVQEEDPWHILRLCALAMRRRELLPDTRPDA
jgi:hypothetical protein